MALEYDDYLFAAHTGHSAVVVTFALAEKIGISGENLILAQVLANEVEGRVGAAVLGDPIDQQLHSFIHLVGGAVIGAKLLGLDRQGMEHAIGISMLQPNRGVRAGFFGSDAKVLMGSMTAPLGVQAAELAAGGLHGSGDVFEGDHGFAATVGGPLLDGAFGGFGSVWLTDMLSYKIYPGCAYIDACIDCILSSTREHHLDARRVQAVHIAAGPLTLRMDALSAPYIEAIAGPQPFISARHITLRSRSLTASCRHASSPATGSEIRRCGSWRAKCMFRSTRAAHSRRATGAASNELARRGSANGRSTWKRRTCESSTWRSVPQYELSWMIGAHSRASRMFPMAVVRGRLMSAGGWWRKNFAARRVIPYAKSGWRRPSILCPTWSN